MKFVLSIVIIEFGRKVSYILLYLLYFLFVRKIIVHIQDGPHSPLQAVFLEIILDIDLNFFLF